MNKKIHYKAMQLIPIGIRLPGVCSTPLGVFAW